LEEKPKLLLERYGVTFRELFQGPEAVRQRLASSALPEQLQRAFESAHRTVASSLEEIRHALEKLDKTLVEAAGHAGAKIKYQLDSLQAKAARAELRQTEVVARHAELLNSGLYPGKNLQEREVGGIYFLARYGAGFLRDLYGFLHTDCLDHQLISL
jgi:uncharacterized protein YllA (UPF0747 family)